MSHITSTEVRSLVGVVFGKEAAETLAYVPGAPVMASELTPFEQNTYERTLKTIIRQTMGNRAAAIFALAEIMTIPGNGWDQPTPGEYYSGTFVQVKKWTKAERDQIRKPLPKG